MLESPDDGRFASPDALYLHGKLATMDPALPAAQAMAVCGDRITAVGSDADIEGMGGAGTRVVDLEGRLVLPGFNDAHTHQLSAGSHQLDLNLAGVRSLREFQERVQAYAAGLAPGEWIIGAQWDHTLWPEQPFPTREDLDPFSLGHPAYLERSDVHAGVANSAALQAAGVRRETQTPAGGRIGRDAHGEPNGMLLEGARDLVKRVLPAISPARRRRALELAMRESLRHGVTSVQDYSGWDAFLTYEKMQREDCLSLRVSQWLTFRDPLETLLAQRAHHDPRDPWLRTGMLKGFLDGSLGSRTAVLHAPYSDDPGNRGIPQYEPAELEALARERARAGFPIGFHAIGDGAVTLALNAFEAVQAVSRAARHRIEHLQLVAAADFARMRRLGVVASVQPRHWVEDERWAWARLGEERYRHAYPWRQFLQRGVPLALGTDYPVAPVNPMLTMAAAVNRPHQEALTVAQAVYAYTMGSAIAEGAEAHKGSLTPGKLADFVVLSQDVTSVSAGEIAAAEAWLTVVGGRIGWQSAD